MDGLFLKGTRESSPPKARDSQGTVVPILFARLVPR
jgi:hypothetical protein